MTSRRLALLCIAGSAWIGAQTAGAQTIRMIDGIANPGFEDSVTSTGGGGTVKGSYWVNAEGRIAASGSAHGNVLVLANPGEFVLQRIPGYEYIAQGATYHEGASNTTTITGELASTDVKVEARVVLEETRVDANAGGWGFSKGFPGNPASGTGLGSRWRYMSQAVSGGAYSLMAADVPGGHYYSTVDGNSLVYPNAQMAGTSASAMRVYEAPHSGTLMIHCRIAWDRSLPQPGASTIDVRARIRKFDSYPGMANPTDILVEVPVVPGDGLDVSFQVPVVTGNLIAFETLDHKSSIVTPATLNFDPYVSFESRQVVYRFGHGLSSIASTTNTYYAPPIDIPTANTWQSFSLTPGADYQTYFSPGDPFAHGPVPQLAVRLEYAAKSVASAYVAFDNIHAPTGFRTETEQQLNDEIKAELDRILGNQMTYAVGTMHSGQLNYHVKNDFNIATGATTLKSGIGGHDALSDLVRMYSTQYIHATATPWLLREADSLVQGRDPELGIIRPYQFSTGLYVDPQECTSALNCLNPPTCALVTVADDCNFFIDMYDLTNDLTMLDMANRLGDIILTSGASGPSLYQGTFYYQVLSGVPTLEKQFTDDCFANQHLQWAGCLGTFARLSARTAAYPSRYPHSDDFQIAADGIATFMYNAVATGGLYGAYWLHIDNALDDVFGHKAYSTEVAYFDLPDTPFLTFLSQGVTHFQPEWIQTFPRATAMAADQQRAWDAWRIHFNQNPTTNLAYGQAFVDAAKDYVRSTQLGNGVWCAGAVAPFEQPDLGEGAGTPINVADGHKFLAVSTPYGDPTLASAGVVSSSLKADLLAYYATMFHLNVLHFGNYLKGKGVTTNQLGYMVGAAYPDPTPPTPGNAGLEFRGLSGASHMLKQLEPSLANHRPTVTVDPPSLGYTSATLLTNQTFTCVDPDGIADFVNGLVWIEATLYQNGQPLTTSTFFPSFDAAFTKQLVQPNTVIYKWSGVPNMPALYGGYQYRFRLSAFDGGARWDTDAAYYEIP